MHIKQIYEIAKKKQQDEHLKHIALQSLTRSVMGSCVSMGIEVVGMEKGEAK